MSRLKYALIGAGRRGITHLNVVGQLEGFDIVGVCDANPEAAQRAAEPFGARPYSDVREMTAREKIDICDVVVPNEMHHAISCFLSRQGIHHNVETPLAPTLGLMDAMIEAAAQGGVKLQTSENFPFLPGEQFVGKVIRSGVIGRVHRTYRLFSTMGYHGLAAIRCRMGARPVAVSSLAHVMPVVPYVDAVGRDWHSEELEFYAVDFEGGGFAIAMVGNKNSCLGRNRLAGFETLGERGTIVSSAGGEWVNVTTDEDIAQRAARAQSFEICREMTPSGTLRCIRVELPAELGGMVEWVNPYAHTTITEMNLSLATLLDGLRSAIVEGTEPLWPAANGRADQEMVLAAGRSIRANRQPIALPLPPDADEEAAFDRDFSARFGIHPRDDPEKVMQVSFRAR